MRGRMEGTGGVQVGRAHRSQPWPWPPPGWASSTVPHLTMDSTRAQERQGTPVTSTTICQTIPGSIHSKPIPRVIPIISHCSHHFPRRSGGLSKEPMVRWWHTKRDVSKNSFKLSIGRLGFFYSSDVVQLNYCFNIWPLEMHHLGSKLGSGSEESWLLAGERAQLVPGHVRLSQAAPWL